MKMTVADVNKVLASVANICECGNRVVFDEEGSYIEHKSSGKRTKLHKQNGVYVLQIRIKKEKQEVNAVKENEQVFVRLGEEMI